MTGAFIAASTSVIADPAEQVTLYGSNGSEISYSDFAIDPSIAGVYWQFWANGYCEADRIQAADIPYFHWNSYYPSPEGTYWIKATQTGVTGAGDAPVISDSLDVWLALNTTRSWGWRTFGGFDSSSGAVRVDIATDSGGSNIVATGYYGGTAESEI